MGLNFGKIKIIMTTIEHQNFNRFLEDFDKYSNSGEVFFRGQANAEWQILPGLGRIKSESFYDKFCDHEAKLFKCFKQKILEKNLKDLIPTKGIYHEDWQWWMAGQHYGLPTRFLDFSHDKFAALQFAIQDLNLLNKDGAFIVYEKTFDCLQSVDKEIFKNPFSSFDKSFLFQAPIYGTPSGNEQNLSERRKHAQGSKFLYRGTRSINQCLSKDGEHTDHLIKFIIPYSIKPELIDFLITNNEFDYDLYRGKNAIDFYAAIIKNEFLNKHDKKEQPK